MRIEIPYGNSSLSCDIEDSRVRGVLRAKAHGAAENLPQETIVGRSLASPIASRSLADLAKGKRRVVIITSDHTRPVPSGITMPLLLAGVRRGNPDADVSILIATGGHRRMTSDELLARFGQDICARERIIVHDCEDGSDLVSAGTLPSGGELVLNRRAMEADLLIAEGFIEPHFFAGFSGGRKAILPGIAGYKTVLANHCAEFISHDRSRTGILDGNPIHADMLHASEVSGLAFILNVVLDAKKRIIASFAGHPNEAHLAGCAFLRSIAEVERTPADIAITGNGGYPLDQNLYQSVKCMTAAEACTNPGGVIIVACEARDGHGGEAFYNTFEKTRSPVEVLRGIESRGRSETLPDQWQIQIFVRILSKHKVIMATDAPSEMIRHLNMIHARSLEEALNVADEILGDTRRPITVIPDGVSVIVSP
ncbi:MAG: nickel-dependent lactate racemase [Synergistaceae bacterium]|nr:nickel-dependent lactate racemase [Synergistaceae bacterium]